MASPEAVHMIARGHVLLAACAALYLAWWVIFFRPGAHPAGALYTAGAVSLIAAAVAGVAGAALVGSSLSTAAGGARVFLPAFAIVAVIAYPVLAVVTRAALARPVTTELVLIVAWCALELACATALGAGGAIPPVAGAALYALIAVLTVGSLVAYVLYYNLGPLASFIDGAVPLAAVGVEAIVVAALLR